MAHDHRFQIHQQFYDLTTPGELPVGLAEMKDCLKLPAGDSPDDGFVTLLLNASTQDVEQYLGRREIRANTWTLLLDEFPPRIQLRRDPVDTITSVSRLVTGSFSAVSSAVYYLKLHTQSAEILQNPDQEWPTDQDSGVEHAVRVIFVTKPHARTAMAQAAIKRHVTFMYENRGDCDPANSAASFEASGARGALARARIQKV